MPPLLDRLLGRLRRETSQGAYIPEVDGIRCLAIAMVFLYHLHGYCLDRWYHGHPPLKSESVWGTVLMTGGQGVAMFFVLSGFILGLPFAEQYLAAGKRITLGRYFLRRLIRLEPPYLANLVVCLAALVVVKREQLAELWPHFLASATYTHNLIFRQGSRINGVAWSLEIECQFYILAPLLAGLFLIRPAALRRVVLVGLAAVSMFALFGFAGEYPEYLKFTLAQHLHLFLAGFLLADFYLVWRHRPSPAAWLWDVIAPLAMLALVVSYQQPIQHLIQAPAMLLLLVCVFRGRICGRIFAHPWIATIGGMCYTFYLYHFLVISLVGRVTQNWGRGGPLGLYFAIQLALMGAATLVVCAVLYLLLERPFMSRRWINWVADRRKPAPELALAPEPVFSAGGREP